MLTPGFKSMFLKHLALRTDGIYDSQGLIAPLFYNHPKAGKSISHHPIRERRRLKMHHSPETSLFASLLFLSRSLFPLVFSLLSCYLYLTVTVDLFSGSSTKSPPVACIILVWQHSSKGSTQSNHKPDLKTYQISTSWAGQCLFLCLFLFVEKPSSALYSHHKYCIHCYMFITNWTTTGSITYSHSKSCCNPQTCK